MATAQVIPFGVTAVATTQQDALVRINDNLAAIRQSKRRILTCTLQNGRLLLEVLKPSLPHGEWLDFVMERTAYNSPRDAQRDMRLWATWKPHIEEMVRLGMIADLDTTEEEFVSTLSDDEVAVSAHALEQFILKGVPAVALEIALAAVKANGALPTPQARDIIDVAEQVEAIPETEKRTAVKRIVTEHAVDNPTLIPLIAEAVEKHPDVADEMQRSGAVYVPGVNGGEGKQVPLRHASETDMALALGSEDIERELVYQSEKLAQIELWEKFGPAIQGKPNSVLSQLDERLGDDTEHEWRVIVFRRFRSRRPERLWPSWRAVHAGPMHRASRGERPAPDRCHGMGLAGDAPMQPQRRDGAAGSIVISRSVKGEVRSRRPLTAPASADKR